MRGLILLALLATACSTTPSLPSAPAAGVAYQWVSFDRQGDRDSGAGGLADRRSGRVMTVDDPARVASVSKIVTALTVMRLVERGRIDLDADVSQGLGWTLRNPAFPQVPITLRQLLSHTASIKDEGDNYLIPLGETIESATGRPETFDRLHPPGTFFRYSNLNFPIVATLLERQTGERFDRLADRLVLKSLGLDACYNWTTCSPARVQKAIVLYGDDGSPLLDDLRGQSPRCQVLVSAGRPCDTGSYVVGTNGALFSPQGGLRISARDLATIGRLFLNNGLHNGQQFLWPRSIAAMTSAQWRFNGSNGESEDGFYCAYGLGIQLLPVAVDGCNDRLFGDRGMIGHAGSAYRLLSGLWINPDRGVGIAYIAANNGSEPPRGRTAYKQVEEWLAARLRPGGAARFRP